MCSDFSASVMCFVHIYLFFANFFRKMSTRELARKMGALEILSSNGNSKISVQNQPFEYLLVLDFEATCWEKNDSKSQFPEIIEFPAVLYDVKNDAILEEFQQYVMPSENAKLSDFCIKLTGIHQNQVDNGVPLSTCLSLFMKWLNRIRTVYKLDFPNSENKDAENKCAFVTWSDWDLAICFKNEVNRKNISYSRIFRKWIDLRRLYKLNFRRPFNGLNGALSELGLTFEGNEHCGLHDARNTARLAGQMIKRGTVLRLTRT